jgi:hypothetical protein
MRLFPYLGGIIREMGGTPLTINGPSDHIHLLAQTKASVPIAKLVETANSTGWVHREWKGRGEFAWQEGYGASCVGPVQAPEVIKYIAAQKEHHRNISFREQFISFLQKYGIEDDERYIWKRRDSFTPAGAQIIFGPLPRPRPAKHAGLRRG